MRVNSYKKVEGCIVGKVETLGLYDVKLDLIEKFKTRKEPIRFWSDDIYLVTELRYEPHLHELGLVNRDFLFYELIPNFYNSINIRWNDADELIGIMFDPKFLMVSVEKILTKKDQLLDAFSSFLKAEVERNQELERLAELKLLLQDAIEQDHIIGFQVG